MTCGLGRAAANAGGSDPSCAGSALGFRWSRPNPRTPAAWRPASGRVARRGRILEPDPLHDPFPDRRAVDGLRETRVVDGLPLRLAHQVRGGSKRIFEKIDVEGNAKPGRHGEGPRRVVAPRQ